MQLKDIQQAVDTWIQTYGVRYFSETTNMILLTEEVGELARIIARKYGEQNFKKPISIDEIDQRLKDEIGDVLFVLICMANQMNIDLEEIMQNNLAKKRIRDKTRHLENPKLKGDA